MAWDWLHATPDGKLVGHLRIGHWSGPRLNGREPYVLADELRVTCDHRNEAGEEKQAPEEISLRLHIPKGFYFDGASIPRWLWDRLPRDDSRILFAATVHDWLYVNRMFTRKLCDRMFLEIMEQEGMPWLYRKAAYYAVRAFGKGPWEDD